MRELHLTDVETEVQGNSTPCPEPLTALTGSRARMDSMCGGVLGSSLLQSTSFLLFWSSWKRKSTSSSRFCRAVVSPEEPWEGCGVLGCVWTFLHNVLLRGPSEVPAGSGCFSGFPGRTPRISSLWRAEFFQGAPSITQRRWAKLLPSLAWQL